jgi:hypothetical protein
VQATIAGEVEAVAVNPAYVFTVEMLLSNLGGDVAAATAGEVAAAVSVKDAAAVKAELVVADAAAGTAVWRRASGLCEVARLLATWQEACLRGQVTKRRREARVNLTSTEVEARRVFAAQFLTEGLLETSRINEMVALGTVCNAFHLVEALKHSFPDGDTVAASTKWLRVNARRLGTALKEACASRSPETMAHLRRAALKPPPAGRGSQKRASEGARLRTELTWEANNNDGEGERGAVACRGRRAEGRSRQLRPPRSV